MTRMIVMVINPGLQITPQVLPPAAENQPYSVTLRVLFGELPIKITIVSGVLPDGLTLVDNGDGTATVSGTPTETGDFAIEVEYEDVREDPRMQPYVVQVSVVPQPPVPVVVSGTAPAGTMSTPYTYTFVASGGDGGPYTWSVVSGTLPDGLTINSATGEISGTPTIKDDFSFVVRATDSLGVYGDSSAQTISVVGDPYWTSVVALLHFDGPNGGTSFADETGGVWTPSGAAQISTAQSVFGGASGYFNGTAAYITRSDFAGADLGTSAFTIEGWIRTDTITGNANVVAKVANLNGAWVVYRQGTQLRFYASSNGTSFNVVNGMVLGTMAANTWYHFAVTRSGTAFRGFLGGALNGSATNAGSILDNSVPLRIGIDTTAGMEAFKGYMDEFRLTKGVARYTAAFTPPAYPFPNA